MVSHIIRTFRSVHVAPVGAALIVTGILYFVLAGRFVLPKTIGAAAGVALMGQARGKYTFFGHLKWTPVIAVAYISSIYVHMWFKKTINC